MWRVRLIAGIVMAAALPLLFISASAQAFVPTWMQREGTLYHAMMLVDGSHIYIDAVIIYKIKTEVSPAYFTIHEVYQTKDLKSAISVLTPPSPQLRLGQTVDIEGDITTLPNGQRAITNVTVYGYTDKEGKLLRHGPMIKGVYKRTLWPYMVDLTVWPKIEEPEQLISPTSSEPNTIPRPGPVFYSRIRDAISGTRVLADGDYLGSIELQCRPIISTGVDPTYGNYFIMGEDSSQDTLKVYYQTAVSTTDRVNKVSGQLREEAGGQVLCVNSGPGYDPQVYEGGIQTAAQGTIAHVRTYTDNTSSLSLSSKVITADRSDLSGNRLYVEEPDRSAGILVVYTGTEAAVRDATVNITGTIHTLSSGERWLDAGSNGVVIVTPGESIPSLMGLNNRNLGGSDFNVLTLGVNTPDDYGLYNIGILAKSWGKVTGVYSNDNYFYIDDGSFSYTDDSTGHGYGMRVSWDWQAISGTNPEVVPPTQNWYVVVSGISSSDTPDSGTTRIRVLRPRTIDDILVISPQDTVAPTPGSASSPTATNSSPIQVTYSGASDTGGTALKKVELWSKKESGGTWTFSKLMSTGASGSFNYTPDGQGTYYFDLVAEDFAGNRSSPPAGNGDDSTIFDTTSPTTPGTPSDSGQYTNNTSVTFNWTAGSDALSGVASYNCQVGTTPGGSNVFEGNVGNQTNKTVTGTNGNTYYCRAQTVDNAGNTSSWSGNSNGIMVDTAAPTPGTATSPTNDNDGTIRVDYSGVSDGGSGLEKVELWYKKGSGSWTNSNLSSTSASGFFDFTPTGDDTYYFDLVAEDNAGNRSADATGNGDDNTIFDTTNPTAGTASSPGYVSASPIAVDYSGASDGGSGLLKVELWYKKGSGSWTNSNQSSTTPSGSFNFSPTGADTYYFDLVAEDNAGNRSAAATGEGDDNTVYDTSPPTTVIVTDDDFWTGTNQSLHASWTASSDQQSGIEEYQYAIGTAAYPNAGWNAILDWTSTGTSTSVIKTGLSLANVTCYYFSVKAKNRAGLFSNVTSSDGIWVVLPPQWGATQVDPTGTVELSWTYNPGPLTFDHIDVQILEGSWLIHNRFPLLYNQFPLSSANCPDYRVWGLTVGNPYSFRVIAYDTPSDPTGHVSTTQNVTVSGSATLTPWYADYLTLDDKGRTYSPAY